MLPGTILVKKTRWVWIVALALSPVAYMAGSFLIFKYDPNIKIGFTIDRRSAVDAARRFASSKGIEVNGWGSLCRVETANNLRFYYLLDKGSESKIAKSLAPEVVVAVRLKSPDNLESVEVKLDPDGRPLGYSRSFSGRREVGAIPEPDARRLAMEAVKSRVEQSMSQYLAQPAKPGSSSDLDLKLEESAQTSGVIRKYTWKWPLATIPELTVKSEVSFRGGVLSSDTVSADLDAAFARNLNSKSLLRTVFSIAYGLLIAVVLIFGVYRFVQRVNQKEISYSRIALVTIVFTSVLSLFILLTDVAIYDVGGIHNVPLPDWLFTLIIYVSTMMIYSLAGLLIGLAYGSGEGDIRESYPGKLTSLDSLITGKLFSQNVNRALLIGCAIGGWVSLSSNAALLPWQGQPGYGKEFVPIDAWFGHLPWMSALMLGPTDVIMITIIGLLIPLPFLHRRFSSRRVIIGLSVLFVWLSCSGAYLGFRPWTAVLLMAATRAIIFLLAFFYFDLLTAIVCIAAPTTWAFSLEMLAQPSATIRGAGITSLTLMAISLLIAFIFAFKGRIYVEDEVRPLYAKLLADRISMQAEVSAAREAQIRLMPEKLPSLPNFSIAACCHPAYEVGGDYYDVFVLDENKIGILIAEGGGNGLGSALSIAYAKGYLTPKILGDGQSDNSPTEIIRGLQDRIAAMIGAEEGVGFAYVVIDEETLLYARVGSHPAIMVANNNSPGKLSLPEEREIKFKSGRRDEADISVIEGRYQLGRGDSVAMLTDGIVKSWKSNNSSPGAELSKVLVKAQGADPTALQEALSKSVKECSKRARKQSTDDDLTVVIVKLNNDGE